MFVWLEGQDVDCTNYASHGGGVQVDVGLVKGEEVGTGAEESDITEIELDITEEEIAVGETFTLTATINDDAEDELIWVSSNPSVATVEENEQIALLNEYNIESSVRIASLEENVLNVASTGKTKTATVTAIGPGTATITAKNSTGSVSHSCTVTVVGSVAAGPYMPRDFSLVSEATATTGYTIKDGSGNQYVWVEVPQDLYNNTAYNTKDTEADMKPASSEDYDKIEYCLQKYTATYRNNTSYKDTWGSQEATGLSETDYYLYKNKMLKSVYEKGGFYVGKYETGIADSEPDDIDETVEARTAKTQAIENYTPVIQANAYPYNFVTCSQAQTLAMGMESGQYTSSLLFGVQWDLVLKYIETKATNQDTIETQLNEDSSSWGNYKNNPWTITNASAKKYSYDSENSIWVWSEGVNNSNDSTRGILLSTGADSSFSKMGIYDLAGNVYEWTLEYTSDSIAPCASRGGYFYSDGSYSPASNRFFGNTTSANRYDGFRVSLW